MDPSKIPDAKLKKFIDNSDTLKFASFSLKILLRQLKVHMELHPGHVIEEQCITKLRKHLVKYITLPNVEQDLKNNFKEVN